MKKKILASIAVALIAITAMATLTTNAPSDLYSQKYETPQANQMGLRNLQDAVPAVAVLAYPSTANYSTTYEYTYVASSTSYVAHITNVSYSAYTPVSFDTATWPIANSAGITYGMCVITNPLIAKTSNFWININGTSSGWKLVQ